MRLSRRPTLMLLAGTVEARLLAEALAGGSAARVVAAVDRRRWEVGEPPAAERRGGFGGAEGMMLALQWARADAVIDASHPFDAVTPAQAVDACRALGLPLLRLRRPRWSAGADADLPRTADAASAAALTPLWGKTYLALDREDLPAFRGHLYAWFLARVAEPPLGRFPLKRGDFAVATPPLTVGHERAVLQDYRIDRVVLADVGGAAERASLTAARALDLPILLVDPPDPPPLPPIGAEVDALDGALAWLERRF